MSLRRLLIPILASLLASTAAFAIPQPDYDLQRLALEEAKSIYDLPDLESTKDGSQLVALGLKFIRAKRAGYVVSTIEADPRMGLKLDILTPIAHGHTDLPILVVFAGSASTLDWLTDLDDGMAQAGSKAFADLANRFAGETQRNVLIAGHSLGGALAQTLGYSILRERARSGMPAGDVQVVTANALGARELVTKLFKEPVQENLVNEGRFYNYFVEDDLISRIGSQLGPTFELTSPQPQLSEARMVIYRHSMDTVLSMASSDGSDFGGLEFATPTPVPRMGLLSRETRKEFPEIEKLQRGISDIRARIKTSTLLDALATLEPIVKARSTFDTDTVHFLLYLKSLSAGLAGQMDPDTLRRFDSQETALMNLELSKH